jgi:glycerate kinase
VAGSGASAPRVAVCAPNAFKGSIGASAVATALARGVTDAGWIAVRLPVADGGDGTLDVLLGAAGAAARVERLAVTGPLGGRRRARLGWIGGELAVVEMAEACGLRLLGRRREPMGATSRGAGELIAAAVAGGARRIVVGVGGSASTDGGAGLLMALGARLLDRRGRPIGAGGGALDQLASVDLSNAERRLRGVRVEVAVDVRNPLLGSSGAAAVYAPQKGADAAEVGRLDAGLRRLAGLVEASTNRDLANQPGTGAAGGAAFALAAIGASLVSGSSLVCDQVRLNAALQGASVVITGEGRLDAQTAEGKAPAEVATRARRAGVPCIAVCGSVAGAAELFTAVLALDQLSPEPRRLVRLLLRRAGGDAVRLVGQGLP